MHASSSTASYQQNKINRQRELANDALAHPWFPECYTNEDISALTTLERAQFYSRYSSKNNQPQDDKAKQLLKDLNMKPGYVKNI